MHYFEHERWNTLVACLVVSECVPDSQIAILVREIADECGYERSRVVASAMSAAEARLVERRKALGDGGR